MRIRTATDLGLVIRDRRKQLGLDQGTLASRACVGRQWVVAIEQGKPRAGVALILRTLDALGLRAFVDAGAPASKSRVPRIDLDAIARARGRVP